jgi:hypothetical protein
MKIESKKNKIVTDLDFDGPMMLCSPITKMEENSLTKWVKEKKAVAKTKLKKKR